MGSFLFFIMIVGVIIHFNKKRKEKLVLQRRELFKNNLQESAMTGVPGGLAAMFFINQLQQHHNFEHDTLEQMHQMDLEQLQQYAFEEQLLPESELNQLLDQIHDPYLHPGMDIIIDEHYFGIDHGLGIANPEHFHHDDFGGCDNSMDHDFSSHDFNHF